MKKLKVFILTFFLLVALIGCTTKEKVTITVCNCYNSLKRESFIKIVNDFNDYSNDVNVIYQPIDILNYEKEIKTNSDINLFIVDSYFNIDDVDIYDLSNCKLKKRMFNHNNTAVVPFSASCQLFYSIGDIYTNCKKNVWNNVYVASKENSVYTDSIKELFIEQLLQTENSEEVVSYFVRMLKDNHFTDKIDENTNAVISSDVNLLDKYPQFDTVLPIPQIDNNYVISNIDWIVVKDKTKKENKACVEFVKYLLSKDVQLEFNIKNNTLPTTIDSLNSDDLIIESKTNPVIKAQLESVENIKTINYDYDDLLNKVTNCLQVIQNNITLPLEELKEIALDALK